MRDEERTRKFLTDALDLQESKATRRKKEEDFYKSLKRSKNELTRLLALWDEIRDLKIKESQFFFKKDKKSRNAGDKK